VLVRELKFIAAALVIAGAALFASCLNVEKGRVLEVLNQESGKVYGKWLLGESGEFSIEFIHSVHQSPVLETFKIEDGKIRPLTVRFHAFGAGMPSTLEEGETMVQDGDAVIVAGFNASYSALNYIVGTVSDHILLINNQNISLRDLCGRNAHISIQVK